MKNTFASLFMRAARQGPRLYFAPLVGAYIYTRDEWRRAYKENHRTDEETEETPPASIPADAKQERPV